MWTKSCDFSYDQPDLDALWAAGYRVILPYVSNTPGKGLTAAYAAKALKLGYRIIPLYETTATMALGGFAGGAKAAATATAIARALGCPAGVPILYALDQNYTSAQMAGPVSEFVRGLHSVSGPDGEYGGINQLRYLIKHGSAADAQFQTYAWSNGAWLPAADAAVRQTKNGVHVAGGIVDDGEVDLSQITTWGATKEPDMATRTLTDADIAAIWAYPLPNGETARGNLQDANLRAGTVANTEEPALAAKVDALAAQVALVLAAVAPAKK